MRKICLLILCVLLATCGCSSKDKSDGVSSTKNNNGGILGDLTNENKGEKETTEKETVAEYTKAQKNELNVQYIGNGSAQYKDEEYTLLFSFYDEDEKELWINCSVDITIKNGDENVYSATKTITEDDFSYWENFIGERSYCASIIINKNDIQKGSSSDGKVFFDITGNEFGYKIFEKYEFNISELPRITSVDKSSVTLPPTPITLNDYTWNGDVNSTIKIDSINTKLEEEFDDSFSITLVFTGSKTFGEYGCTYFNCRLINEEGFVVDSSMLSTEQLNVGDKFNTLEGCFYCVPEGNYTVEIFEYK